MRQRYFFQQSERHERIQGQQRVAGGGEQDKGQDGGRTERSSGKGRRLYGETGTLDANTLLGFIASERGYDNNNKYGAVFVVSEEELEAGISPSRAAEGIASQVKLEADTSKLEKIGVLDSPERVAAAVILGVDGALKELVENPFVNVSDITYAVSGRKVTLVNDVVYYLIVVEMSTSDD